MTFPVPVTPTDTDTDRGGECELPLPTLMGWTCREARCERVEDGCDGGNHRTPWTRGWRRDTYERVICPFWAEPTAGLAPVRPDGRLSGRALLDRLPPAAVELAGRTPLAEHERFLAATGVPFEVPIGPVEPDCRCRSCAAARRFVAQLPPTEVLLRFSFAASVARHVELVLRAPNRYDRAHGAPRAFWRGSGASACFKASDLERAAQDLSRAAA